MIRRPQPNSMTREDRDTPPKTLGKSSNPEARELRSGCGRSRGRAEGRQPLSPRRPDGRSDARGYRGNAARRRGYLCNPDLSVVLILTSLTSIPKADCQSLAHLRVGIPSFIAW